MDANGIEEQRSAGNLMKLISIYSSDRARSRASQELQWIEFLKQIHEFRSA